MNQATNRPCRRALVVALALTSLVATPLAAHAQAPEPYATKLIALGNVNWNSADQLARNVCDAANAAWESGGRETPKPCVGFDTLEGMIAVSATMEVASRIEALLAELGRGPQTRAFQIVALEATLDGAIDPNVPGNVATALADVGDFLPFTGYGVIGTGWLRSSERGSTTLTGDGSFRAELRYRSTTDPAAPMLIEEFRIFRTVENVAPPNGQVMPRYQEVQVLHTTFTIEVGETVVVGTSKLNGEGSAVVVLLTAIQD